MDLPAHLIGRTTPRPAGVFIGCAGWSIPKAEAERFPGAGSHLDRYSRVLLAAEINSSFHRPHQPATYARWAASVPQDFRFSVKVPKTITHEASLKGAEGLLSDFLAQAILLGDKLGCFLVQLPPKLAFDLRVARSFFEHFRSLTKVPLACEPRHASWFEPGGDELLAELHIARVAADPAKVPAAALPGGSRHFSYYRLHGSPKIYYSAYTDEYIHDLAMRLSQDISEDRSVWCIFDNTTLGAAATNALDLQLKCGGSSKH